MPWRFNPFTGDLDWTDAGAHTQNTDTKLDEGGANEISVTEIPKKATANITYYVATNGNDTTGDGTSGSPFATIQHAADLMPESFGGEYIGYILLKDGTYIEGEILISGFSGRSLYIGSDSDDADLVKVVAPADKGYVFYFRANSAIVGINYISVKIQKNSGFCVLCKNNNHVEVFDSKLGDNGNTGTVGVLAIGSGVSVQTVTDIDANKVSTGISSRSGSLVVLYDTTVLGDTFVHSTGGGIISDGITLNKADYDDSITKKHTQNTDTALGAQSENLNMNTHKITGVVDPMANQEAATKKYVDDNIVSLSEILTWGTL